MPLTTYEKYFDTYLINKDSILKEMEDEGYSLQSLLNGISADMLLDGVFGGTSSTGGVEFRTNADAGASYLQSRNYDGSSTGWRIDSSGDAYFYSLTLTGGTIKYGKTSFADSTNAGYWIGSSGIYIGSAADASYIKYDISGATLTIEGTTFKTSSGNDRIEITTGDAILIYDGGTIVMQMTAGGIAWSAGATPTWFGTLLAGDLVFEKYGSSPTVRYVLDSDTPSFYSFNEASLGTVSKPWNIIRGTNIYGTNIYCTNQTADEHITGDLSFRYKGKIVFRIDENPNQLKFYNKKGRQIMTLDQEGNLWLKGKINE